jgi:hypothetical protein
MWLPTAAAAIQRAGGTVTYLTAPGHEGEPAVVLPEGITDADLARMTALERLQPTCVQFPKSPVTNNALETLKKLPKLRLLFLFGTKVNDAGLPQLKAFEKLEILNLDGCAITDRGLADLEALPSLRLVSLYGTHVTADGVKKLQANRPKLEVKCEHAAEPD